MSAVPSGSTNSQVTIVVGMHRSGTSMLTRGLVALGLHLGENLSTEAAPDNAKGHWEDRDVVVLNDRLLAAADMSWDEISHINPGIFDTPGMGPLYQEAEQLIATRLEEAGSWAFKDPRTARLLSFWLQVLEKRGTTVRFLWAVRRPDAVARSLKQRNGFHEVKSSLLWLRYNLDLCNWIGNRHCVVVDYDLLLTNSRAELMRVASAFGIKQINQQALATYCDDFIDRNLDHWPDSAENTQSPSGAMHLARRAYQLLESAAGEAASFTDQSWSDGWAAIRSEHAAYDDVCRHLDAMSRLNLRGADLLADGFEKIHALKEAAWSAEASGLRSQIESLKEQVQTARERAEALADRARTADENARNLLADHRRMVDENLGHLRKQLEAGSERMAQLQQRLERAERRENQLEEEVEQREAKIDRQAQALEEANAHKRHSELEQEDYRSRLAEQQSRLANQDQRLNQTIAQLNRERYTVIRPLLRKGYRAGAGIAARLPPPLWRGVRKLKRALYPGTVALDITSRQEGRAQSASNLLLPAVLAAKSSAWDILVFPVIDWHFRFQRPQHLARQMASRGHRVFYLTTTFADGLEPGFEVLESPSENVFIVQLCLPGPHPRIYEDVYQPEEDERLIQAMYRLMHSCELTRIVSLIDLPFWRPLAQSIPGNLLVYDCMDYHGGFSTNSKAMLEEEDRLLKEADLVITTSDRLSAKVAEVADNTLIRNAGDIEYFSTAPDLPAYESNRPVAGYLGAIAEWFDVALVADAARRYPDWQFVLVGSTHLSDVTPIRRLPNVELIGEVPYEQAAAWVHSFDVSLIPFRITELTLCTNPVKAYEYLAAGKPVVSTALPEAELMDGMVHVASDNESFLELLGVAMAESADQDLVSARTEWAAGHDWATRGDDLEAALNSSYPLVSVIVLTYNNLEFTRACLKSLELHSHYPNWELVLVDNASSDDTPEFLRAYAQDRSWVKLILNDENTGFAAGNNLGLQAAEGEYLVVLNNDTYVTDGWILDLIRHLKRNPGIGLIGPVTNNIGNESKIDIHYADMQEMAAAAFEYTSRHPREVLETRVIAFFCAAMRRSVYEEIGGLDEAFGRGFFEDDDYCNRVRAAGYGIGIAEDVFVHHHLSGSFAKLEDSERRILFERNKAIYEEKWGEWIPHQYRN